MVYNRLISKSDGYSLARFLIKKIVVVAEMNMNSNKVVLFVLCLTKFIMQILPNCIDERRLQMLLSSGFWFICSKYCLSHVTCECDLYHRLCF